MNEDVCRHGGYIFNVFHVSILFMLILTFENVTKGVGLGVDFCGTPNQHSSMTLFSHMRYEFPPCEVK